MEHSITQFNEIAAERLSSPVCRIRVDEEQLVVSGLNEAFVTTFGESVSGTDESDPVPVETVLEDVFDITKDWTTLRESIVDGERFTVEAETGSQSRYTIEVTPPEAETDGYLLFTDITGISLDERSERGQSARGRQGEHTDSGVSKETEQAPTETDSGIAIDHVASVVSHDLRNPLDVARARLRAGRELDEDEHFDHVEQAHERMERIIQDVLTLARGEDVVDPDERVALGTVAEQAWGTVETNEATLTVETELPTALADPDRVSRLFENLFRNALEHGKPDGESVTVRVGRIQDEQTDGFYVADDGPGVESDHQEDIFKPGYSTDDHGTGLGLAIVARIGELHGWDVTVTESADGGARFEIGGVE